MGSISKEVEGKTPEEVIQYAKVSYIHITQCLGSGYVGYASF